MGRHQYLNEDEYEVNLKDFEPQPGELLDNLTILIYTCVHTQVYMLVWKFVFYRHTYN